jgi:hypothetical protein
MNATAIDMSIDRYTVRKLHISLVSVGNSASSLAPEVEENLFGIEYRSEMTEVEEEQLIEELLEEHDSQGNE